MAKKKLINQLPRVNMPGAGSYSANLINQTPTMPTQMQSAQAVAGASGAMPVIKSYSEYVSGKAQPQKVNSGAGAVTGAIGNNTYSNYVGGQPMAVQPVTGAQSPATSYSSELIGGAKPVTGSDVSVSGSSASGSKTTAQLLDDEGKSIVDQYNSDVDYAGKTKDEAYKKAEDSYSIAVRDANANYRTNQPTYGATAENLLAAGLSGSGYSDYLAGKAYEARTDEINAARSQMSYAKQLADSNYEQMMYQAGTDKRNAESNLSLQRMNYSEQLNSEYKSALDAMVNGIMNGIYDASVAEKMLKNYTIDGVVPDDAIRMLQETEANYAKANANSTIGTFISWAQDSIKNDYPINAEIARDYLKRNTNLSDEEINVYINAFFNEDGSVNKEAVAGAGGTNGSNSGSSGNTGSTGSSGGQTGTTGTNSQAEDQPRWSGDEQIVRGNARFKNDAWGGRSDLTDGDNFNITVNGKTYRVESGGELTDETVLKALSGVNIDDGEVFSYGDQAFLKKNGRYYEIDTRVFRPNAEGNLVNAIGENTAAASNAENVGNYSYTSLAKASIWNSNAQPMVGKVLALETADGKMRVKISSELGSDTAAYKAAVNDGIKDGQAFIHGEDVYVKKGDKVYMIAEDKKDYDSLKTYLNYNQRGLHSSAVKVEMNAVKDSKGQMIQNKANVTINGNNYKMTYVGKYYENESIYKMFTDLGVKDGEMVLYHDKPYLYYNNSSEKMIVEYDYDGNIDDLKKAFDPEVEKMPGVKMSSEAFDTKEKQPATKIIYNDKNATMIIGETEGTDSQVYRKAEADGVENNEIFVFGGNTYQYTKGVGCTKLTPYKDAYQTWEEIKEEINESGKNN